MEGRYAVRIVVRSYELDLNGHVNHANYHRYGEHSRTEHMSAAGCSMSRMVENGMGIVLLETHCRFLNELRYRDVVDVESRLRFGEGKTFEFEHTLRRRGRDGAENGENVVAAEITCRMGLLDSNARRLLSEPRKRLLELATDPVLLGG